MYGKDVNHKFSTVKYHVACPSCGQGIWYCISMPNTSEVRQTMIDLHKSVQCPARPRTANVTPLFR